MTARTITSPTHRGDAATARNVVRGHRMTPISLGRNPSVDGETSASGTELNQSPNTANVQFCSLWAAAQHRAMLVGHVEALGHAEGEALRPAQGRPFPLFHHNFGSGRPTSTLSGRTVQAEKYDEPQCPARRGLPRCSQAQRTLTTIQVRRATAHVGQ